MEHSTHKALDLTAGQFRLVDQRPPLFRVVIDGEPLTLACRDSFEAWTIAVEMAGPESRVEVTRLDDSLRVVPFPIKAARQQLEVAMLREVRLA